MIIRAGGRTYHMPNYATRCVEPTPFKQRPLYLPISSQTSYANEKSNLISIHLEEHKGTKRGYIVFTLMVLLIGIPMIHYSSRGYLDFAKYDSINLSASHPTPMEPFKPEDEALKASRPANDSSDEDATENTSTGEAAGNERLGVYWEAPIPAEQCSAYGMREYHAKLKNLPFFSNGMDVCQNTPIEIHGQSFASPDRCDRRVSVDPVHLYHGTTHMSIP
jgi:hypothetical protein